MEKNGTLVSMSRLRAFMSERSVVGRSWNRSSSSIPDCFLKM